MCLSLYANQARDIRMKLSRKENTDETSDGTHVLEIMPNHGCHSFIQISFSAPSVPDISYQLEDPTED